MVFQINRYLESLWVCLEKHFDHWWRESKNYVLGMIVKTFGTWAIAIVSVKHSQVKEWLKNKTKGGKKLKQRVTIAFFDSTGGGKFGKPILIWKSRNPWWFCKSCCKTWLSLFFFKPKITDASRHYRKYAKKKCKLEVLFCLWIMLPCILRV